MGVNNLMSKVTNKRLAIYTITIQSIGICLCIADLTDSLMSPIPVDPLNYLFLPIYSLLIAIPLIIFSRQILMKQVSKNLTKYTIFIILLLCITLFGFLISEFVGTNTPPYLLALSISFLAILAAYLPTLNFALLVRKKSI